MSDAGLTVSKEARGAALIVKLAGDAGVANAEQLSRELTRIQAGRPKHVVLDLSGLTFISSLSMGELVQFARGIASDQGKLAAAGLTEGVKTAFDRARLHEVIKVYETVDAALAG